MKKNIVIFIVCLTMLCTDGCLFKDLKPGEPEEYFPLNPGTTWEYTVEIGDARPIQSYKCCFPRYATVHASNYLEVGGDRILKFKLKEAGSVVLPVEFTKCVELEIINDDLDYFADTTKVYLAVIPGDGFCVSMFVRRFKEEQHYGYGASYYPTFGNVHTGFTQHNLYFDCETIDSMSVNFEKRDIEILEYVEFADALHHYRRVVEGFGSEDDDPERRFVNDQGYTEDMWFKKGVGLTRLEQTIGGETSMVWELTEFTPGEN